MKPQVIFDSKDTLRDKAAEVGIPVVNCLFTTFDEMKKSIELSATVFGGNAPKIANKYNKELTKTVDEVEKKTKDLSDSDRPKVMHGNSVYTLTIDGTSPSGPAYPRVPKRHAAPRRAEGPRALFDSADSSVSTSGRMPRPRERWRSPTGYEYRPGW